MRSIRGSRERRDDVHLRRAYDARMSERVLLIDAFASGPFTGNPAAVVILASDREEVWLRAVANELGAPMTAFLRVTNDSLHLRWFAPTMEVHICGHATMAAAHAVWSEGLVDSGEDVVFATKRGDLRCRRDGALIEIDLPIATPESCPPPSDLEEIIGARVISVHRNSNGSLVVEVEDAETVRSLAPDLSRLALLPDILGVAVTAPGEGAYDCVSRYFAPACGIDEDPVCGSAHCTIGPLWSERLGKTTLLAHQASARGGDLRVRVAGDRVLLGGRAVTSMRGVLTKQTAHEKTPVSATGV